MNYCMSMYTLYTCTRAHAKTRTCTQYNELLHVKAVRCTFYYVYIIHMYVIAIVILIGVQHRDVCALL